MNSCKRTTDEETKRRTEEENSIWVGECSEGVE